MPRLQLFITEKVPRGLRGQLTRWMLELRAGVFIGTLSTLVGQKLWGLIQSKIKEGGAIWIRATNTEQRFQMTLSGNYNRILRNFEGLYLITIPERELTHSNSHEENSIISEENIEGDEINEANLLPDITQDFEEQSTLPIISDSQIIKDTQTIKAENKPQTNPLNNKKANSTANLNANSTVKSKANYGKNIAITQKPTWDTEGLPDNFIYRYVNYLMPNSQFQSQYIAKSSYYEFEPNKVWDINRVNDLEHTAQLILKQAESITQKLQADHLLKIACVDIETTNFIKKAYEGFVNIVGLSILIINPLNTEENALSMHQTFNMLRKRSEAPKLLTLMEKEFKDIDLLLVFNQDFDIKILNQIIAEFQINMKFPPQILDLKNFYPSLHNLESNLARLLPFKREHSQKGVYEEYYAKFKGEGKNGINKQIEPIGVYNIMDCLSPLLMFLLLYSKKPLHELFKPIVK
mgnify:CR=1 FL=1